MKRRLLGIKTRCPMCGKDHYVKVEASDYLNYITLRKQGVVPTIKMCFPYLDAEEAELLISGTCNDCWSKIFPEE